MRGKEPQSGLKKMARKKVKKKLVNGTFEK